MGAPAQLPPPSSHSHAPMALPHLLPHTLLVPMHADSAYAVSASASSAGAESASLDADVRSMHGRDAAGTSRIVLHAFVQGGSLSLFRALYGSDSVLQGIEQHRTASGTTDGFGNASGGSGMQDAVLELVSGIAALYSACSTAEVQHVASMMPMMLINPPKKMLRKWALRQWCHLVFESDIIYHAHAQ